MILDEKVWQQPIKKLRKNHINEMAKFASPPPAVYAVYVAIGILFAPNKNKNSTMMQFFNIYDHSLSKSPQRLLYMMYNLDASLVPEYKVQIVEKWLI